MSSAGTVSDCLTIDQVKSQYASQWVVIGDPVLSESLEVLSGRVISHGHDRDAVYQAAIGSGFRDLAFLYTGEAPADLIIVL